MPTFSANGATLAYTDHGTGKPIVFVHGIYSSQEQWKLQVDHFKDKYQIITCDLRGHGRSSTTKEPYTVQLFAGDLIALLDHLELEQAVICGHSFGGLVAQELALSHPDRVRGIILAETLYGLCSTPWDAAAGWMMNIWFPLMIGVENYVKMVALYFGMYTPGGAKYIIHEAERHLDDEQNQQNILKASLSFDSRWRLHQIDCPTLLIVGQYPHIPYIQLHNWEMYWRIKDAELKIIPGAGHMLFWDNPNAFHNAIDEFMAHVAE